MIPFKKAECLYIAPKAVGAGQRDALRAAEKRREERVIPVIAPWNRVRKGRPPVKGKPPRIFSLCRYCFTPPRFFLFSVRITAQMPARLSTVIAIQSATGRASPVLGILWLVMMPSG